LYKISKYLSVSNGLYLAEQADGIIIDWDFFRDKLASDAKTLKDT